VICLNNIQNPGESGEKRPTERYTKQYGGLNRNQESLRARASDIFTSKALPVLTDNSPEIAAKVAVLNRIIDQNNKKTESLTVDQLKAREELRLSEIAQFIQEIDLSGEENKVAALQKEVDGMKTEVQDLQTKIQAF
jgi:hypothetical protein